MNLNDAHIYKKRSNSSRGFRKGQKQNSALQPFFGRSSDQSSLVETIYLIIFHMKHGLYSSYENKLGNYMGHKRLVYQIYYFLIFCIEV